MNKNHRIANVPYSPTSTAVDTADGGAATTLFEGVVDNCERVERQHGVFNYLGKLLLGRESRHILTVRNAKNQSARITVPDSSLGSITVAHLSAAQEISGSKSVEGDTMMTRCVGSLVRLAEINLGGRRHHLLSFVGPGAGPIAGLAIAQGQNLHIEIEPTAPLIPVSSQAQLGSPKP